MPISWRSDSFAPPIGFLPKYAAFFVQGIEYTLLLAVVSVLLAIIPALMLALMRLLKMHPIPADEVHLKPDLLLK